ncbi:MAG: aminoglycoside phosphotransferase family protein [Pseudonocardiaceae bacterium]
MSVVIPRSLHDAIIFLQGEADGGEWLRVLPARIDTFASSWCLVPEEVLIGGAMSCCVACTDAEGDLCVLKIPIDVATGRLEAAALTFWDEGGGVPTIKRIDDESGTILMRFVEGGAVGMASVASFADLLGRLHGRDRLPARNDFPDLESNIAMRTSWATDRFNIPEYSEGLIYLPTARRLATRLLEDGELYSKLCHGDLQTKNILTSVSGAYVAIDPLPVVGDPHFDAAFWCVMQDSSVSIRSMLAEIGRRLPQFGVDRLNRWAWVIAALELRPYLAATRDRMLAYLDEQHAWIRSTTLGQTSTD